MAGAVTVPGMPTTTNTTTLTTTADICADLDGCVSDWVTSMGNEAALVTGRPRHEFAPATQWNFMFDWDLTVAEFLEIYANGVKAGRVLHLDRAYPGALDGWQMLLDAGHRIHVVTDRRPPGAEAEAAEATAAWLARNGFRYHNLVISADKTVVADHAEGDLIVAVDDRVENYQALEAAGIEAFLMDRPWNHHLAGARRVTDFVDFAHQVNALCA